jgi:hypothetical protein
MNAGSSLRLSMPLKHLEELAQTTGRALPSGGKSQILIWVASSTDGFRIHGKMASVDE